MAERPVRDRRQHPRYDVAVRVHVAQLGVVSGGLARDISEGGLFIETAMPYPKGSCVPLRLIHAQSAEQIATVCEVVRHVHNDAGKVVGLGLRFVHLDAELLKKIRHLIGVVVKQPADQASASGAPDGCDGIDARSLDFVPLPKGIVAGLKPQLVHVLSFVDGERTVDEVARTSGLAVAEVLSAVRQLEAKGCIHIKKDLSDAINTGTGPVVPKEQVAANQPFIDERAREHLADAVRAERSGRIAEAVNLLEQALALAPGNASDIHVRLIGLALGPVGNVQLARQHLEMLQKKFPEHDGVDALAKEIGKRALEPRRQTTNAPPRWRMPRIQTTPLRVVAGAAIFLMIVAAVGWSMWMYALPRGEQPSVLAIETMPAIGKVENAQVFEGCLFVKVNWSGLSKQAKAAHLSSLAAWAATAHGVQEVVVSDNRPVILGQVNNGEVTVY